MAVTNGTQRWHSWPFFNCLLFKNVGIPLPLRKEVNIGNMNNKKAVRRMDAPPNTILRC